MRVLAAVLALMAFPAAAQTMCVKPAVPACMIDNTTFVDANRMIECQTAVREYIDRTMEYLTCLNGETVSTGQEMKRNVDHFNCRLSARTDCN